MNKGDFWDGHSWFNFIHPWNNLGEWASNSSVMIKMETGRWPCFCLSVIRISPWWSQNACRPFLKMPLEVVSLFILALFLQNKKHLCACEGGLCGQNTPECSAASAGPSWDWWAGRSTRNGLLPTKARIPLSHQLWIYLFWAHRGHLVACRSLLSADLWLLHQALDLQERSEGGQEEEVSTTHTRLLPKGTCFVVSPVPGNALGSSTPSAMLA